MIIMTMEIIMIMMILAFGKGRAWDGHVVSVRSISRKPMDGRCSPPLAQVQYFKTEHQVQYFNIEHQVQYRALTLK